MSWDAHQDTYCVGVSWDRFDDVTHACGLLRCIGGHLLAAIFERFLLDMRFTRSGLPDLTVWNPDTGKFKVSLNPDTGKFKVRLNPDTGKFKVTLNVICRKIEL